MLEYGKIIISGFIVILLGVILIQPIGDDIELTKVGSRAIIDETVTLSIVTKNVVNETVTLASAIGNNNTGTIENDHITTLTEIRNISSEIITGFCNVTLSTGAIVCNATGNRTCYVQYTFNDYSTGSLTYDEIKTFDSCTNSTLDSITIGTDCNITLANGDIIARYDNFTYSIAIANYTYEPDTYVHSGTARSLLSLTRLFFALFVMIFGAGMVVIGFKKAGVM